MSTRLVYHLPNSGSVSLKIYNLMGQEVEKLIDSWQSAGIYDVTFTASTLASGLYFARLRANDSQQLQKLLLLK